MTKKIPYLVSSCLLLIGLEVSAQNSVGIGTPTPNPRAVLELVSPNHNQGLMVPRLTTAQRTAGSFTSSLTAAENGLLVFDSDDQKFYYWQNSQWFPIRSGADVALTAGTGINITGNTISAIADGDGNATNEIQDLSLIGNTLKITNNASATGIDLSPFVDGDGSATNEIQDLQFSGGILKITNNPSATPINLSPVVNTDDQTLSYDGSTGQLSITTLLAPQAVTISAAGAAGGDLTGSYPNPTIATGKVTSTAIADGVVASIDIADGTITTTDISDGTIANIDIANVDAAKITTGTLPVTRGGSGITAVVPGAVAYGGATNFAFTAAGTTGQLLQSNGTGAPTWINPPAASGTAGGDLTGSYPNPTIATGKVTSAAIADGTIVNADILNMDASKITTGTVLLSAGGTGASTAAGARTNLGLGTLATASAITTTEITNGTIIDADIASVDATKITTGTLPVTRGGSGITAVVPGAIAFGGATNFAFTAAGTTGQLLQSNGAGTPTWINPPTASGTAGGDLTGSYPNPTIGTDKVTSTAIQDGTITNIDIANVDASKITTGTLPVTRGGSGITAVVPGAIAYGGATNFAFTAAGTTGQLLQSNGAGVPTWINPPAASGTAGGDLTGSFPNPTIAASKVTSTAILDGTIATVDVATDAITTAKILDATIATADLADNAITSIKISDGVVSSADITDNSVATGDILDGTIGTVDIAANAITPAKIAASATVNQVLTTTAAGTTVAWAALPAFGFGSVTSVAAGTGLSGGTITTTGTLGIAAGGVTATELASNAVTDVKVANVAPGKLTQSGAATGDVLKWSGAAWAPAASPSGTVTSITAGTGLSGGTITASGTVAIAVGGVTATELAANAVTDVKIATGITASKITASGTVGQVLTTTGVGTTGWATVVDNSVTNEIQTISKAGSTVTLSNGGGSFTDAVNDADADPANEIQDLKSVLTQGTDANASTILNVGMMGIGTTTPKAHLSVVGSQSVNFVTGTSSYAVKPDDYLLVMDGDGTVVTLPPSKNIPGRVLVIRTPNASKGIDVKPASGDNIDGYTTIPLMDIDGQVNAITIVADGKVGWWIINKTKR